MSLTEYLRALLNADAAAMKNADPFIEWLYGIAVPHASPPLIGTSRTCRERQAGRWIKGLLKYAVKMECPAHQKPCIVVPLSYGSYGICAHLDPTHHSWIFTVVHYQADEHPSHSSEH